MKTHREKKAIDLDKLKYFSEQQIKALRRAARERSELGLAKGLTTPVREWMIIDVLSCTGLRVSECSNLTVHDLHLGHGQSELIVQHGKCNVTGSVQIPSSLKLHLRSFLVWKQEHGEAVTPDSPLFIGQRGKISSQGIQQICKKYLKKLGIYEQGKSVHALRHSYATQLYRQTKDLRLVQKQLRHVSVQSTLIYADIAKEEIQEEIKGLWN